MTEAHISQKLEKSKSENLTAIQGKKPEEPSFKEVTSTTETAGFLILDLINFMIHSKKKRT